MKPFICLIKWKNACIILTMFSLYPSPHESVPNHTKRISISSCLISTWLVFLCMLFIIKFSDPVSQLHFVITRMLTLTLLGYFLWREKCIAVQPADIHIKKISKMSGKNKIGIFLASSNTCLFTRSQTLFNNQSSLLITPHLQKGPNVNNFLIFVSHFGIIRRFLQFVQCTGAHALRVGRNG